jgi:heat shock protein HslJ
MTTTVFGRALAAAFLILALATCAHRGEGAGALVGSTWLAQTIDGQAAPAYPASTLRFETPSFVNGRAGCTAYSGTIGIAGQQLAVGALQTTPIACEQDPPGLTGAFLQALQAARSFRVTEWTLALSDSTGRERLSFTRMTGPL